MTTIAIDVHDRICQDLHQQIRSLIVENERLKAAAQQALDALEGGADSWQLVGPAIDALKEALVEDAMQKFTDVNQELEAALAEPEGGGNLPPPLPGDFDHAIGADRFKVVRGAFWWHVLIGDSPTKHGKFHSRASAEKMAADLLREFRNGAFVQHEAALEEPVQSAATNIGCLGMPINTPVTPPQRKPLTEEEIDSIWDSEKAFADIYAIVRVIERAHGIGGRP